MLRKFPSIAHSADHGYSFDSDAWTSSAPVNSSFRMYQTFGDRLIQHSHDWPITIEYLPDYLMSFAQAMLKDPELTERLSFTLERAPQREEIEFAASVVFKPHSEGSAYEKKTRYYSISERKITSNPDKRHDKRYHEVEHIHDGSPNAIYRMILPEYGHGLEAYQTATGVYEYWQTLPSRSPFYMEMPALFLDWTKNRETARYFRDALEAARSVAKAHRLRDAAENAVNNAIRSAKAAKESRDAAAEVEPAAQEAQA